MRRIGWDLKECAELGREARKGKRMRMGDGGYIVSLYGWKTNEKLLVLDVNFIDFEYSISLYLS
jgi:hypothetical protein